MNQHDEDLQNNIEAGTSPVGDDLDIQAYREVFSRLGKAPDFSLPATFSDAIVTRIIKKKKKEATRELLWFGSGALLLIVAFVVAVIMSGFKLNLGFLENMASYLGLFIFGALFILVLHFLDKKMISQRNVFGRTKQG